MLEITSDDIAALNDEDFRTLVGLLCEAELLSLGWSNKAATWGGNQNAPDGGIDVRVRLDAGASISGFLPRASIGIQAKKNNFQKGMIADEMRPKGVLRDSIKKLIDDRGAYIIASSGTNAADDELNKRLEAMKEAVADYLDHETLYIDFYDRNRLASWVRNHPSLILWVRQKIGRALPGWQPYTSWALSPDGVKDEYLLDDKVKLHYGITDNDGLDVAHGITRIRNVLRRSRGVVRLAGLSGVGKTRLVQALFDSRVGENTLDYSSVIYTDMNDDPSPQPTGMVTALNTSKARAIVVIDNCAAALHRRLAELCRSADSTVSLITVEYDVQEDEPEGTEVFRLEPSTPALVEKLLERRFPDMIRLNFQKIADISGGNARVALALANTLSKNESIAGLNDEELFRRLFHQRQGRDDSLLKAAKAFALVYSFEGEALSGESAELPVLGSIVGLTAEDMYTKAVLLKQRDLVQKRSVWRAVLPHAIANRLAEIALRELPASTIEAKITSARMLKSFSRRLSYLHDSPEACAIAVKWLQPDGYVFDVARLNELGRAILVNIAPLAPGETLAAIEAALAGPNAANVIGVQDYRAEVGSIIRALAYEASMFKRATAALVQLALPENERENNTPPIQGILKGLCQIWLSGTHAPVEARIELIGDLLSSPDPDRRKLGLSLLPSLLQTSHFSATHNFEFGVRVRDYGFFPRDWDGRVHWYVSVMAFMQSLLTGDRDHIEFVKDQIAKTIDDIWFFGPSVQDIIEKCAEHISRDEYWKEAWIIIRGMLKKPLDKCDATSVARLRAFEISLRPKSLLDRIRAVVLTQSWGPFDFADSEPISEQEEEERPLKAYERANELAEQFGRECGKDAAALDELLPEIVAGQSNNRLGPFGKGLASARKPDEIWKKLSQALLDTEADNRNWAAITGFLVGVNERDAALAEQYLDEALMHSALGLYFPIMQTSIPISEKGIARLKKSTELGKAGSWTYQSLGWGRSSDIISGPDMKELLSSIRTMKNGFHIVCEILSMRLHSDKDKNNEHPKELIEIGRELLSSPEFQNRDNMRDYRLTQIANASLSGPEGVQAAKALCEKLRDALFSYKVSTFEFGDLISTLFRLQPQAALDGMFDKDPEWHFNDFDDDLDRKKNPLEGVDPDLLIKWCEVSSSARYKRIAQVVNFHKRGEKGEEWSSVAIALLKSAPEPKVILETFIERFRPSGWSGSLAEKIEARMPLLDQLADIVGPTFTPLVGNKRQELREQIVKTREWENKRDKDRDERFES